MYDKASLALIPSGYKSGGVDNLYSVLPANGNGDFNATRGSTATRVNKDALIETVASDVPRLDYPLTNGVVGDCPHLLLEPSRENVCRYTEDFSQSTYGTTGTTKTPKNDGSSLGVSEYVTVSGIDANNDRLDAVNSSVFPSNGQTYTYSAYFRASDISNVGKNINIEINTNTGVGGSGAETITLTSDWVKHSVSVTFSSSVTGYIRAHMVIRRSSTSNPATSVDIVAPQIELGSYATSYIPNLSSGSTTRSADVCNSAGTSAEFNDSEGVLFAEIASFVSSGTGRRIAISDGDYTDRIEILYGAATNRIDYQVISNNVFQAGGFYTVTDVTDFNKVAVKYKQDDFALWINGVEVSTDNSGSTPTGLNTLRFEDGGGGNDFYGKCKQLIVFNEALIDSELQTLTS